MANSSFFPLSALSVRIAAPVLAALSLAACQTASPYSDIGDPSGPGAQPNFPVREEQVAAPPAPPMPPVAVAPAEPPPPIVSGNVQSNVLPPPPGATPRQVVTAPPPAYSPPAPPAMVSRTIAGGRVVDADGPSRSYTVKPGQGLDAVARELGTTREVLANANNLKEPYALKAGQRLKGPPSRGKAYVVESGDTLFAIARRFSVNASAIASANDRGVNDAIRPGQRLILPSGYRDIGAGTVQVAAAPPAPSIAPPTSYARPTPTPPAPSISSAPAAPTPRASALSPAGPPPSSATPLIDTAPTPSANQVRAAGTGRFIWPLRGRIIDTFGPKPGNQKNDGLNIAASLNQSVKAAAGGTVVYAGSEVPEFGNLVLIRHDNGFVTAYGHLARIGVRIQDNVSQNQEIGTAGQSGGVPEPQLHFEVRYAPRPADRPNPIDPALVLPE